MAKSVEKAYGHALFLTAEENSSMEKMLSEAESLLEIVDTTPELMSFLLNPDIHKTEKMQQVEKMLAPSFSSEILGLLSVVLTKGRQQNFPGILRFFIGEAKESLKIGTVEITTPTALDAERKKKVEEKILSTTPYEKLEVRYHLDPSLLGGMVIRVGDTVVDSSIKHKLKSLESSLLKAKL